MKHLLIAVVLICSASISYANVTNTECSKGSGGYTDDVSSGDKGVDLMKYYDDIANDTREQRYKPKYLVVYDFDLVHTTIIKTEFWEEDHYRFNTDVEGNFEYVSEDTYETTVLPIETIHSVKNKLLIVYDNGTVGALYLNSKYVERVKALWITFNKRQKERAKRTYPNFFDNFEDAYHMFIPDIKSEYSQVHLCR